MDNRVLIPTLSCYLIECDDGTFSWSIKKSYPFEEKELYKVAHTVCTWQVYVKRGEEDLAKKLLIAEATKHYDTVLRNLEELCTKPSTDGVK